MTKGSAGQDNALIPRKKICEPVPVQSQSCKQDKEKEHFRRERTYAYVTKESALSTQYRAADMRFIR